MIERPNPNPDGPAMIREGRNATMALMASVAALNPIMPGAEGQG